MIVPLNISRKRVESVSEEIKRTDFFCMRETTVPAQGETTTRITNASEKEAAEFYGLASHRTGKDFTCKHLPSQKQRTRLPIVMQVFGNLPCLHLKVNFLSWPATLTSKNLWCPASSHSLFQPKLSNCL